jgi:hypothetical protein
VRQSPHPLVASWLSSLARTLSSVGPLGRVLARGDEIPVLDLGMMRFAERIGWNPIPPAAAPELEEGE